MWRFSNVPEFILPDIQVLALFRCKTSYFFGKRGPARSRRSCRLFFYHVVGGSANNCLFILTRLWAALATNRNGSRTDRDNRRVYTTNECVFDAEENFLGTTRPFARPRITKERITRGRVFVL